MIKNDKRYKRVHSIDITLSKREIDERRFEWMNRYYIFKVFLWLILLLVFINAWN